MRVSDFFPSAAGRTGSKRERAVELRLQGWGQRRIGIAIGVSHETVRHWIKDIYPEGKEHLYKYSNQTRPTRCEEATSSTACLEETKPTSRQRAAFQQAGEREQALIRRISPLHFEPSP